MGIFGDGGSHDDYLQLEARVASLESLVAQLAGTVAALTPRPAGGAPATPVTGQRWELEARVLTQAGKKIEAIKVVREATNWGLREAKDFVDRL